MFGSAIGKEERSGKTYGGSKQVWSAAGGSRRTSCRLVRSCRRTKRDTGRIGVGRLVDGQMMKQLLPAEHDPAARHVVVNASCWHWQKEKDGRDGRREAGGQASFNWSGELAGWAKVSWVVRRQKSQARKKSKACCAAACASRLLAVCLSSGQ